MENGLGLEIEIVFLFIDAHAHHLHQFARKQVIALEKQRVVILLADGIAHEQHERAPLLNIFRHRVGFRRRYLPDAGENDRGIITQNLVSQFQIGNDFRRE